MKQQRDGGRREAAGDGATGRSVKTLQFHDVGVAQKRKPSGRSIREKGPEKSFVKNREGLFRRAPRSSRDTAQGLEPREKFGLERRNMF